ncbi:hypothetical protein BKA62DRAFT_372460 [Auriculariales sp. MPI-PUGE-AT-0066]|nr:hypothetical protein BKA62DRAFT_372460 [Auriculariales sp. MPI-PUGE-AT-0066]
MRLPSVAKWQQAHHHHQNSRSWRTLLFVPIILLVGAFVHSCWQAGINRTVRWPAVWQRRHATMHHLRPKQGLLLVNSVVDARHPIVDLIQMGERVWQDKLQSQSKTLREAYDEYVRRYKRRPPRGFDKWWEWCRSSGVQLLDEYDQINRDLEFFWSVKPSELIAAQAELETHDFTHTIGKTREGGNITILAEHGAESRAQRQLELIDPIKEHLPPFRATWYAHDAAWFFTSWEIKEAGRKAVAAGTYVDISKTKVDPPRWSSACPPDSALHSFNWTNRLHDPDAYTKRSPKAFIADFFNSMDPCHNPDLIHLTTLNGLREGPDMIRTPFPLFARSKVHPYSDILGVPAEDPIDESPDSVSWHQKNDARLMWRGTTTGQVFNDGSPGWNMSHRLRFVQLANKKAGSVPVIPPPNKLDDPMHRPEEWQVSELNEFYFDVGLTGTLQCDPAQCDEIHAKYTFKDGIHAEVGRKYKYILDMDGNGWSSRFRRMMSRNSIVLKSTVYPEWWTDRSMPWVHYVPVNPDYGDIYDVMAFFRGLPNGTRGHDDLAKKIATAGRKWVDQFWREKDMTAYTWRLYLEYARVMSEDRSSMDFIM